MDKHPEITATLNKLKEQKAAVEAKTLPLRKKRDELLAQIQPIKDEIRRLEKEYKAIESSELITIENQISRLTVALGARTFSGRNVKS